MQCEKCESAICSECKTCGCGQDELILYMSSLMEANTLVIESLLEKIDELQKCKLAESPM